MVAMNAEKFKEKFKNGEHIDDDVDLSEEILPKLGIHATLAKNVFEHLWNNKVRTWGNLRALGSESENKKAIEAVGGKENEVAGTTLWNAVQDYNKRRLEGSADSHPAGGTKKARFEWQTLGLTSVRKLLREEDPKFVRIPKILFPYAGLGRPFQDVVLYRRPAYDEQFGFLKKVLDEGFNGFVYGPSGTGKSSTTLAFCLSESTKSWAITWIHLDRMVDREECLHFAIGSAVKHLTYTGLGLGNERDEFAEMLANVASDEEESQHLVVLDGFIDGLLHHSRILTLCDKWSRKNCNRRRFVIVSSLASRPMIRDSDRDNMNLKDHLVFSWTLDEYTEAVRYQPFYDSVQVLLDAKVDQATRTYDIDREHAESSPLARVKAKYYFAGGSSRFMFARSTEEVMNAIREGIEAVQNISDYIEGKIGAQAPQVVNRLLGRLPGPSKAYNIIVSQFAAYEMALELKPDTVYRQAETYATLNNPSLMGWIFFEIYFFSLLRWDGVRVRDQKRMKTFWEPSKVQEFKPQSYDLPKALPTEGVWLKPEKWNQGGYDAVFLSPVGDRQVNIRFVQAASGNKHDLRLDIMRQFIPRVSNVFEINLLTVVFLVPRSMRPHFRISTVEGNLVEFGWARGHEAEKCDILELDAQWPVT